MDRNIYQEFIDKHGYPFLKPRAVLFDMDGVLFNSMPNHAEAWYKVMNRHGMKMGREEAYLHEGRTGASTIDLICRRELKRAATEEEKRNIYKEKTVEFNSYPQAEAMPGALNILYKLKDVGIIPVLVTGSGQRSLIERLNSNFPGMFVEERMVTAYDVKHGKPDPEPYLMGLKRAGVEAYEALVVENAPMGVEAGASAGIFTIAVNTGPLPDDILWQKGANMLFPSMCAFNDALDDILRNLL